jgi:cell division protein FtsB
MYGPSRYICDVLEEMRKCFKHYNFSIVLSLIEECQTLANRMESALSEQRGIRDAHEEIKELKAERKQLKAEIRELEKKKEELDR